MTTIRWTREATKTGRKARPELPWNVLLHNDWENSMPRVVIVLKKTIPGMTIKKATRIMYEAHSSGQAVVKRCHKELAELYEERLRDKGLTVVRISDGRFESWTYDAASDNFLPLETVVADRPRGVRTAAAPDAVR